jgi:hypothetical protein
MRILSFCLSLFFFGHGIANDSLLITQLLQRISAHQAKESSVFPKGAIPSYRMYALNQTRFKADPNPFFTGLTVLGLQDIKPDLSPAQQQLVDQIVKDASGVYPKYKNRKNNRDTYNFWQTDTPKIFPNGGWLNLFDKPQALPDDLDDTVIILMALQSSDSVARKVHALMQAYTNRGQKRVRNTFEEYRNIGAYSTWFGKKMPIDFDVCVLSNILYFVQKYQFSWTAADSASLHFIEQVLASGKHKTHANYVSAHYADEPKILYHVSRLMALRPIPILEKLKPALIADASAALQSFPNFMDKVLLSTALLRWGILPENILVDAHTDLSVLVENEEFSFFIASMASMLPDGWKKMMTRTALGSFFYYSPGYNNLLLLENLVWYRRVKLQKNLLAVKQTIALPE